MANSIFLYPGSLITGTLTVKGTFAADTIKLDATNQDVVLIRDGAANTLALRNGTATQSFHIGPVASYLRLQKGTTGNDAIIRTEGESVGINFGTNDSNRWLLTGAGNFVAVADNTYDLGATGATRPRTGFFGTSIVAPTIQTTNLLVSATAPTIASGFGTGPSVPSSNGTAAFTINVGTGGTASSGVIGLPTATNGWVVLCTDISNAAIASTVQVAGTVSGATIANYARATGVLTAWTASDVIRCLALAY